MTGGLNLVPGFYQAWSDEIRNEVDNSDNQPTMKIAKKVEWFFARAVAVYTDSVSPSIDDRR